MMLYDRNGQRLYLTIDERRRFLEVVKEEVDVKRRMLCRLIVYTGCRSTEALELTAERILLDENKIVFRSLKKRKLDGRGNVKSPQFRIIPVRPDLIEGLDLTFNIRKLKKKPEMASLPLWNISRGTQFSLIKKHMKNAGIVGKQACPKGLRHSFALSLVGGDNPVPLNVLQKLMGHTSSKTTEIYTQFVGKEEERIVLKTWED